MGAIDDETFILEIKLGLGPQLTAKVLGGVSGWSAKSLSHLGHINDDSFDAITLTFYFGHKTWHFVAIEDIADVSVDVDTHGDGCQTNC